MANDDSAVWGGQIRLGRSPASGELLVGNSNGGFKLTTESVEVQNLLNSIGTTQGAVLHRNATSWVAIAPPVFNVTLSANQTITSGVYTKINFDTVIFDPEGYFDTVNYQYEPLVAGYYQINAIVEADGTNLSNTWGGINKNGSEYAETNWASGAIGAVNLVASTIVYLNGSTDYIDFYVKGTTTSGDITIYGGSGTESYCRLTGSLIRFD